MKITKFVHSCLLVETPDRVALFDPGAMSEGTLEVEALVRLDDIFITHVHGDHCSIGLIKRLVAKFPEVRITSTPDVVTKLGEASIQAGDQPPAGASLFDSPHESVEPLFPHPQEIGVHYLDMLSHPGDSHSFQETKAILALPMQGPWGHSLRAYQIAVKLKPQHVLPIHDWHWHDEARRGTYDLFADHLSEQGITFHKLETGQPVEIEVGLKVAM